MILSMSRRLIFIKGVKVAGTSVEMALSEICGPDDIVTPITPRDELDRIRRGAACRNFARDRAVERAYLDRLEAFLDGAEPDLTRLPRIYDSGKGEYFNHMSLAQVEALYPGDLTGFQIVCAERSPYSKVLSLAYWSKWQRAYSEGSDIPRSPEMIKASIEDVFRRRGYKAVYNIDRYRQRDGRVAARVLRWDNLPQDIARLWSELGVTTPPYLPNAKKGIKADELDPRTCFTPRQIDEINRVFAAEFDAFGFPRL